MLLQYAPLHGAFHFKSWIMSPFFLSFSRSPSSDVHFIGLMSFTKSRSSNHYICLSFLEAFFSICPSGFYPSTCLTSHSITPIWMKQPIEPILLRQCLSQHYLQGFRWIIAVLHHMFRSIITYVAYYTFLVRHQSYLQSYTPNSHFHPP